MTSELRTIAVGFDGSREAQDAVTWTLQLAATTGADVVIVHAVGLLEHMANTDVTLELDVTVRKLALKVDFDSARIRWLIEDGDACSVLVRCADEPTNADLLVVGSRGRGAHAGHLLGSTSLQVAERSSIPIVIVPTGRSRS